MIHHPLVRLLEEPVQYGLGLMSGTSMDGVDAALVRFARAEVPEAEPATAGEPEREGEPLTIPGGSLQVRGFGTFPYDPSLVRDLERAASAEPFSAEDFSVLDQRVSRAFADAVGNLLEDRGFPPERVHFVASHGQTVAHGPRRIVGAGGGAVPHTLQLGRPAAIAALTGILTVGDFRTADVTLGGEGAPLVPLADFLLHASPTQTRVLLNLGGIANLTHLPAGGGPEDVSAFDTGPGNMVIDGLVRRLSSGRDRYDYRGARALRGRVHEALLRELREHPFFDRDPPRSAGHREFGSVFVDRLLERGRELFVEEDDLVATATELTVASVVDAVRELAGGAETPPVYVCGGGARNGAILEGLRRRGLWVESTAALGLPPDRKEAVDFALLGREALHARAVNLVRVTGAARSLPLGTIALASVAARRQAPGKGAS
jgi:anhydro-N-acetylmuramic acid kinase